MGEPAPPIAVIVIADYDPSWPRLYEREQKLIRGALNQQVRVLQHVGSTSVPGLAAKPRIDILLGVPDSANESAYRPTLEMAGYTFQLREPDWHEHRLFKGPDTDINLHIFPAGDHEIERMLAFRDHLRNDDADRALYERTKRDLASRQWATVQDYADAKTEVVEAIMVRALTAVAARALVTR